MSKPALFGKVSWQGKTCAPSKTKDVYHFGQITLVQNNALRMVGQSFVSQSSNLLVAVFGRICFWPEHADETLQTANQAELVANAFDSGMEFLEDLAGDFAIVVWDQAQQKLYLIKDHLGTRPLFYTRQKGSVSFATDIASLRKCCEDPTRFDETKVIHFLTACHDGNQTRTMFAEIGSVPPASVVCIEGSGIRTREYWRPESAPKLRFKSDEEYYALGRNILKTAIQQRIPQDQPIAVHLSAGLDSSAIAAVAAEHCRQIGLPAPVGVGWQPPATPNQPATRDQELMQFCAETFAIPAKGSGISKQDQQKFFALDPCESLCTQELVLEIGAQRAIADEKRPLVLSGWGGDQAISCAGRSWRRAILPHWVYYLWKGRQSRNRLQKGGFVASQINVLTDTRKMTNLTHGQFTRPSQIAMLRMGAVQERMDCWSMYFADQSIQYAFPLLDRRLVEFALGVPGRLYSGPEMRRNLMRQILRGLVPDRIRLRPDKQEPSRIENTLQANADFAPMLLEMFQTTQFSKQRARFLNMKSLEKALKNITEGKEKTGGKLNRAISFLLGQKE